MVRRTTENGVHRFQNELFESINAFEIQGLTMDESRTTFTAGVEYFDLDKYEYEQIRKDHTLLYKNFFNGMISPKMIHAQAIFTQELSIPLFYIWGYGDDFLLHQIAIDSDLNFFIKNSWWIKTEDIISFWRKRKQTVQIHTTKLNGAAKRASRTRIDAILQANGLEWGGNVDGFILKNNKTVGIIDCISIGQASQRNTNDLTDKFANPALYFFKRGPKYETWLSTVLLAQKLKVPHLLITLNKVNDLNEEIGLTTIDCLTKNGIKYSNGISPNNNVILSKVNILNAINNTLNNADVPKLKK